MEIKTNARGVVATGTAAQDLVEACAEIALESLRSMGQTVAASPEIMQKVMAEVLADLRLVAPAPAFA